MGGLPGRHHRRDGRRAPRAHGRLDQIAAFTLMVTVLDESPDLAAAVIDERTARLAAPASRARGYLDGRSLAEVFAWLRPNDLIWNYWVNNYLLGTGAASLRHPVLERGHHPADVRLPPPDTRPDGRQPASAPGHHDSPRHAHRHITHRL